MKRAAYIFGASAYAHGLLATQVGGDMQVFLTCASVGLAAACLLSATWDVE